MSKTGVFCVFGMPESVLRIVLTIRFASYGRFLTLSWSKSVDFYALFGLLGGGRGVEKGQAVRGFRTGMKKVVG